VENITSSLAQTEERILGTDDKVEELLHSNGNKRKEWEAIVTTKSKTLGYNQETKVTNP
jgi:hypothetical protein